MSNKLMLKRNALMEKAKKKQELAEVRVDYKNTPIHRSNLGEFQGLHSDQLDELCKKVKLPTNYNPKSLDERSNAEIKKDNKSANVNAEVESSFVRATDRDTNSMRKSQCHNFISDLYEELSE